MRVRALGISGASSLDPTISVSSSVVSTQTAASSTLAMLDPVGSGVELSAKEADAGDETRERDEHERDGARVAAGLVDGERQVARRDGSGCHHQRRSPLAAPCGADLLRVAMEASQGGATGYASPAPDRVYIAQSHRTRRTLSVDERQRGDDDEHLGCHVYIGKQIASYLHSKLRRETDYTVPSPGQQASERSFLRVC